MKTNNLPDYPRIALADLSRLKLDPESARRFERRFYPGLIGGTALAFGGAGASIALGHFSVISDWVSALGMVGSFVFGVAIALYAHHRMMRARPQSAQSGRIMQPFIIGDLEAPDRYELAYVDQHSGTYFRRLYVERGG